MENFYHPLAEAERGLSAQASRGTVRGFASNDLKKDVVVRGTDEILTEAFHPTLPGQVTAFAAKQLIDIFLLERLIGKMSLPSFFEKEHSSTVLDSLMFDILLQQFFSIRQCQRATFENIPLRDFHLKAFTKVALDVILTELNKMAVEDMEDLLEYERGVQEQEPEALPEASES
ncbi:PREDICTED: uncharacterized protein LOC107112632 isoform X2 [Gekko japonicus]|nr:PREDICTED: uncharacterized protein LOC107112632 isoform X2 [Gekko japonicus]